jgi:hypothetical protein
MGKFMITTVFSSSTSCVRSGYSYFRSQNQTFPLCNARAHARGLTDCGGQIVHLPRARL